MQTTEHPISERLAMRRLLAPLAVLWTVYSGALFIGLGLLTLPGLLLIPPLAGRRRLVRAVARTFFLLSGLRIAIRGRPHLPAGPCVVVANHASYLDGVLLCAVLPSRFGFVIKREMEAVPLAGLLLRRIGAQFVERTNRQRGAGDARRVMRAAASGQSLAFFPEGTFSPRPGLMRFHAGAFVTAARAGLPVVPIVIRGTRRALPPDGTLPLPQRLRVEFLAAITLAEDEADMAANLLREQARAAILAKLPEPDLAS